MAPQNLQAGFAGALMIGEAVAGDQRDDGLSQAVIGAAVEGVCRATAASGMGGGQESVDEFGKAGGVHVI
ncbi:hypothetical protein G3I15_09225, partial [Streptomyces sp. SID10244]|nr:hypothetical protein [Streptomyces sp. SID10244]